MSYEVKLKVGQYHLDRDTLLDVRLTDMGAVISVCDADMNIRYTFMVDDGKLVFGQIARLIPETDITPAAAPVELPPSQSSEDSEPSALPSAE